jgi:hypothetical protein
MIGVRKHSGCDLILGIRQSTVDADEEDFCAFGEEFFDRLGERSPDCCY